MVVATAKAPSLSLESFLALPETKPAQEYDRGIITQKPMPKGKHSRLQSRLARTIDQLTEEKKIALALTELRCSFGDRSIVPDIAVVRWQNLPIDEEGEIANQFNRSPDWIIEILSPDQSTTLLMEKIIFCLKAGTELGWLIDPGSKSITVFTAGLPQIYFADTDPQEPLTAIAEIKDWQITAAMIFDWLRV
ncbi:MAG: Uma2 family endonuclease [Synechocystis sp.]|nr:Uma2 family endonuclease [Synechocystis sp.]